VTGSNRLAGQTPGQRYDRLALPFVRHYTRLLLHGTVVPDAGQVLDHGAGTGELSLAIHRRHPTASVTALDPDPDLLAQLRVKAGSDAAWLAVVHGTLDTTSITIRADVVFSQLVLSLTTDPGHELAAMRAHTAPGGTLRAAVLAGPDRMRAFAAYWQAASAVIPGAQPASAYPHLQFTRPDGLRRLTEAAGWQHPRVEPADTHRTATAAQLWQWLSQTLPLYTADGDVIATDALSRAQADALRQATLQHLGQYRNSGGHYKVPTGGWLLTAVA